jgi:hypothetical protein
MKLCKNYPNYHITYIMDQTITIYNNYLQIGFPGSKNGGVLGVAPPFTLLKRPARFSATPVVSEHSNDAVNQLAREEQLWRKVNCSGGEDWICLEKRGISPNLTNKHGNS